MTIYIKIGTTAYDGDNDRTITVKGRHFGDYIVDIAESVYDEDGTETGETVTEAVFTQAEINSLFGQARGVYGRGHHVVLED